MRFIALVALVWAANSFGATFVVEDNLLTIVPPEVKTGILQFVSESPANYDGQPCEFIGKTVALKVDGLAVDWVVTTANACDWAASAAPVWVLSKSTNGKFGVVLFHVTYDLTVGSGSQNGLHHIATARATAARREDQLWKFDGKIYQLVKMKAK